MTYFINYTPETDDVFVYNQPFTVWPTRQSQVAISENPNLPLKNQTVVYNGETITYDIDLSGVENPYRSLAYFYCSNCFQVQPNWPHCTNFWAYSLGSVLMGGNGDGPCSLALSRSILYLPASVIDPTETDELQNGYINAQYWNDPNLWHTSVFRGNVLIESESDDETYLYALGHAITTQPCNNDLEFVFFDRTTNKLESRLFQCPCTAWDLPLTGIYPGGLQCNNCCAPPYSIFTSQSETRGTDDAFRFFVMKKGQEPLPKTIKKYKVLLGKVRKDNWPVFGIDSSFRFIRCKTNPNRPPSSTLYAAYRTREDGNFKFGQFPYGSDMNRINDINIGWDDGEGDDGPYPSFTITPEGETIFVSFNSSRGYSDYISNTDHQSYNQPLIENVPRPCTDDNIFYKEDGKLKFNTYCYPAFFHPELVIPGYPENDINFYTEAPTRGIISRYLFNKWNEYLEQLGKPKMVSYQFPEFTEQDSNIFPDTISDTDQKYPLFNSPYLSRQSKNSFFQNTNLIDFNEKRMLQASELNELQEKFYKKQSLLVQYHNKWLSKNNLKKEIKDILGFSKKIDLNSISSSVPKDTLVRCCKAIPIEENILTLGSKNENNIAQIKLNPCNLMLYSNFTIPFDSYDLELGVSNTYYNNTDFIKIDSEIIGELDLSNITENNIHCITLSIDIDNIINCDNYQELKDNSSQDNNSSAPCGASRNYLSPIQTLPIIQQNIDITSETFLRITQYTAGTVSPIDLTPFNTISTTNVRYLLGYMKKENGQINFYYANGVKIQNI